MSDLPVNIFGTKYQVRQQLASKGGRKTLLAQDTESDILVVIKLLTFNDDFRWDDLKLFEREAETLKSLSHPAIPQYLDYFEIDTPEIKGFALVQSYIEAYSLAQQIEAGKTFSEAEVKQIARQILEILDYLHSRQPRVIHRDIKPSNILLANRSGNSVGQLYLIDFGSVQNAATKNTSTLTVVGTYGYMPPEQFGGRAKPASDIYSLGATIIYLVTGEHPADLPETDLKIEFEEYCNLSPGFTHWLKRITNPSMGSRLAPAKKALEALGNCDNYRHHESAELLNKTISQPTGSKIIVRKSDLFIEIEIPSIGLFNINNFACLIFIIFTGIFIYALSVDSYYSLPLWLVLLLGLTLYLVELVIIKRLITSLFGVIIFRVDRTQISFGYKIFGTVYNIVESDLTKNIYRLQKYQVIEKKNCI